MPSRLRGRSLQPNAGPESAKDARRQGGKTDAVAASGDAAPPYCAALKHCHRTPEAGKRFPGGRKISGHTRPATRRKALCARHWGLSALVAGEPPALWGAEAPRKRWVSCGDHSRKAGCPRFFRQPYA